MNRGGCAVLGFVLITLALGAPCAAQGTWPLLKSDDCRPAELRSLLAGDDSCVVGKACGRIDQPWLYRGPRGRGTQLRFYGARTLPRQATRDLAELLLRDAVIDSAGRVEGMEVACAPGDSSPVYVASFFKGDSLVRAVLRFDTGQALFFGSLSALGSLSMGANADSLWSLLATALDWDARLAGPRPALRAPAAPAFPSFSSRVDADEQPVATRKVTAVYPPSVRLAKVSGLVMVQALVGRDGLVHDAVVTSGPVELYDSALEAVWQWRFLPARSKGRPLAAWVAIPVDFRLN